MLAKKCDKICEKGYFMLAMKI